MIKSLERFKNRTFILVVFFSLCLLLWFFNNRFEVIAFNFQQGSSDYDLRILTWNIRCTSDVSEIRQREIARLILDQKADFVLLNEFNINKCSILHEEMNSHYRYTEEIYANKRSGDIFYSKLKLYNSGHKQIPIWGKTIPSISATVKIGSDSVFIVGVHLVSNSGDGSAIINSVDSLVKLPSYMNRYNERQKERTFSADWLCKWVEQSNNPTIVMGDMNDFSFSLPLKKLESVGMKDAWWDGGIGYGCTYHDGWMNLRIDHVYYTNKSLDLNNIRVLTTELSDHNPIIADFKIKNKH